MGILNLDSITVWACIRHNLHDICPIRVEHGFGISNSQSTWNVDFHIKREHMWPTCSQWEMFVSDSQSTWNVQRHGHFNSYYLIQNHLGIVYIGWHLNTVKLFYDLIKIAGCTFVSYFLGFYHVPCPCHILIPHKEQQ